jgi:NTE family protein
MAKPPSRRKSGPKTPPETPKIETPLRAAPKAAAKAAPKAQPKAAPKAALKARTETAAESPRKRTAPKAAAIAAAAQTPPREKAAGGGGAPARPRVRAATPSPAPAATPAPSPAPAATPAPAAAPDLAAPAAHGASKTINLALQGGGAHGAFTWGALDRLLEEERIEVEGITATSAGAMNAAAFKSGFVGGGRPGAKAALEMLWGEVGAMGRASPNPLLDWVKAFNPTVDNLASAIEAGPGQFIGDTLTRMFSPYDLNPLDLNPLRQLLNDKLDFDAVCKTCAPHLFISATNVRSGKIRVFRNHEVSVDVILASTCLPTMFQAVELKDPDTGKCEAFWDGGFVGNPALFPLFYETDSSDIVIVHINPMQRDEVPRTTREIANRMNEVSFNASLMFELRSINFVRRLIEAGAVRPGDMKNVLVHSVKDDKIMGKLGVATKSQPDAVLLRALKSAGRVAMDGFLTTHWDDIGQRPTIDLQAMFS